MRVLCFRRGGGSASYHRAPLAPTGRAAVRQEEPSGPQLHSQSQSVEAWKKDPHNLVMDLERSLKFLQQQHAETLMKLHEEIEYLKRENKGEVTFHVQLYIDSEKDKVSDKITSPVLSLPCQIKSEQAQVPPASSNPFLVSVLPSHIRKPPTLEECEIVIHQLWNINHMQAQEVRLLPPKSDLKLSHYQSFLSSTLIFSLILTPLPAAERAVLPALKQTLGNSFAERQKRTQAIQRSRLRRTVL
uniref:Uncharacterized protein n=1 Tax=Chelonoidis abingdonii TaxID=106734 RepID=A0A8C0GD52_CHEAB